MADKHTAGVNTGPEQKAKDEALEAQAEARARARLEQEQADKSKFQTIAGKT